MTLSVLGVDTATKTGWACLSWSRSAGVSLLDKGELWVRSEASYDRITNAAREFYNLVLTHKPDYVVVENYGFSNKHTLVPLVEIGTMLRYVCHPEYPVLEVPPTTLKKFVTGKGNVAKNQMMLGAYKNWGIEGTDNEVDAYALAMFGLCVKVPELTAKLPAPRLAAIKTWVKAHPEA